MPRHVTIHSVYQTHELSFGPVMMKMAYIDLLEQSIPHPLFGGWLSDVIFGYAGLAIILRIVTGAKSHSEGVKPRVLRPQWTGTRLITSHVPTGLSGPVPATNRTKEENRQFI